MIEKRILLFLNTIWNNIEKFTTRLICLLFLIYIINALSLNFLSWLNSGRNERLKKIKFAGIGGLWEAKEELKEIIEYFKNSDLFISKGIEMPKGIILFGPPGNGKTLLARALANESKAHFIFKSASEFEDTFVGVGARRIRKIFSEARSYPKGCIIFIDEIDSIGGKRNTSFNNHYVQTLNQLLSEMDGILSNDKIFIIAATNSIEVLDSALLRPGRFDRKIYIGNPDLKSRKEIIKLSILNKPFDQKIDFDEVASMTIGYSSSEIVSVINESLALSMRESKEYVDQDLIFEAVDRVTMGPLSKSLVQSDQDKKVIAYHEAGHALIGLSLPETSVTKITISNRGNIGGYTAVIYRGIDRDEHLITKNQIIARVMSLMGGRLSEELIFGEERITSGAHSDLKRINGLLNNLFFDFSMSGIGIIPSDDSSRQNFSNEYLLKIEIERDKIIRKCQKKVKKILEEKKNILDLFANVLIDKKVILKDDIFYLFVNKISPYLKLLN